jgi:hypothetical protein
MSTSPPQLTLRGLPSVVPPLGTAFGPWGWLAGLLLAAVRYCVLSPASWLEPNNGLLAPRLTAVPLLALSCHTAPSAHAAAPTRRVVRQTTAGAPKIASVIQKFQKQRHATSP